MCASRPAARGSGSHWQAAMPHWRPWERLRQGWGDSGNAACFLLLVGGSGSGRGCFRSVRCGCVVYVGEEAAVRLLGEQAITGRSSSRSGLEGFLQFLLVLFRSGDACTLSLERCSTSHTTAHTCTTSQHRRQQEGGRKDNDNLPTPWSCAPPSCSSKCIIIRVPFCCKVDEPFLMPLLIQPNR